MGSGGTTALRPPGKFCFIRPLLRSDLICIRLKIFSHPPKHLRRCKVKPHGSLVPVSSTHRCAYTPGLSTYCGPVPQSPPASLPAASLPVRYENTPPALQKYSHKGYTTPPPACLSRSRTTPQAHTAGHAPESLIQSVS